MMAPRHFLMRVTRFGPLVPARLVEIDTEPGEPENARDRWPATILCADVAGEVVPPEELTERLHVVQGHWKHAGEISASEYEYRFKLLRWAETNRPNDPTLKPKKRVCAIDVPLPSFESENEAIR